MSSYKNPLFLRLAIASYRGGIKTIAKLFEKVNSTLNSCDIHCQIEIGENSIFMHSGKGCVIHEATKIGNNVRIFHNVTIGAGAVILGNVRIGKNSIIGANSVVNHDVEMNTVVAGIPARVIKRE